MEFARMTSEKPAIHLTRLRSYRLQRIRDELARRDIAFCVLGSDNGGEGVKLEQMILITEVGNEPLSSYPFEGALF